MLNTALIKAAAKNSIQVIVKLVIGFANIKLIAVLAGPSGMATFGILQNYLQMGSGISNLGFQNGIIKYLAAYKSESRKSSMLSTAIISIAIVSLVLGISSLIFASNISQLLFNNSTQSTTIQLTGIYLITSSAANLASAILTGFQHIGKYILLNIFMSISGFILIVIGLYYYGTNGLLIAFTLALIPTSLLAYLIAFRGKSIKVSKFNRTHLKRLMGYSLMNITSAIIAPLTLIIVRGIIINNTSLEVSGYWEGINKISNNYILVITASFSYYFLPKFSKIGHNKELRKEIKSTLITVLPLLAIGGISIYLLRDIIIKLLFDESFNGMEPLFIWQILGDTFKITAWIFATLLIAKGKIKTYIFTEIVSFILITTIAWGSIVWLKVESINLYYFIENVIYLTILVTIYRRSLNQKS